MDVYMNIFHPFLSSIFVFLMITRRQAVICVFF